MACSTQRSVSKELFLDFNPLPEVDWNSENDPFLDYDPQQLNWSTDSLNSLDVQSTETISTQDINRASIAPSQFMPASTPQHLNHRQPTSQSSPQHVISNFDMMNSQFPGISSNIWEEQGRETPYETTSSQPETAPIAFSPQVSPKSTNAACINDAGVTSSPLTNTQVVTSTSHLTNHANHANHNSMLRQLSHKLDPSTPQRFRNQPTGSPYTSASQSPSSQTSNPLSTPNTIASCHPRLVSTPENDLSFLGKSSVNTPVMMSRKPYHFSPNDPFGSSQSAPASYSGGPSMSSISKNHQPFHGQQQPSNLYARNAYNPQSQPQSMSTQAPSTPLDQAPCMVPTPQSTVHYRPLFKSPGQHGSPSANIQMQQDTHVYSRPPSATYAARPVVPMNPPKTPAQSQQHMHASPGNSTSRVAIPPQAYPQQSPPQSNTQVAPKPKARLAPQIPGANSIGHPTLNPSHKRKQADIIETQHPSTSYTPTPAAKRPRVVGPASAPRQNTAHQPTPQAASQSSRTTAVPTPRQLNLVAGTCTVPTSEQFISQVLGFAAMNGGCLKLRDGRWGKVTLIDGTNVNITPISAEEAMKMRNNKSYPYHKLAAACYAANTAVPTQNKDFVASSGPSCNAFKSSYNGTGTTSTNTLAAPVIQAAASTARPVAVSNLRAHSTSVMPTPPTSVIQATAVPTTQAITPNNAYAWSRAAPSTTPVPVIELANDSNIQPDATTGVHVQTSAPAFSLPPLIVEDIIPTTQTFAGSTNNIYASTTVATPVTLSPVTEIATAPVQATAPPQVGTPSINNMQTPQISASIPTAPVATPSPAATPSDDFDPFNFTLDPWQETDWSGLNMIDLLGDDAAVPKLDVDCIGRF